MACNWEEQCRECLLFFVVIHLFITADTNVDNNVNIFTYHVDKLDKEGSKDF